MKGLKKTIVAGVIILALVATSLTTLASSAYKTPEEIKAECLQIKKDALAEQVSAGKITQAQADAIISAVVANQALCDGTGTAGICADIGGCGAGVVSGAGNGCGMGGGRRAAGGGCGMGRGMGCR